MSALSRALRQVFLVTAANLRSLPARRGPALAAVTGIAGVVAVLLAVLSMATGFEGLLSSTGDPDTVIVLQAGSDSEMTSNLDVETTRILADAPGLRREVSGPVVSREVFVAVDVPKKTTGTDANVPLRGVESGAFRVRDGFELTAGRLFETGKSELIVGSAAAEQFAGLGLGAVKRWGDQAWTVVGRFSTGGTAADTEIWGDASLIQAAYNRAGIFNSVYARLEDAAALTALERAVELDPRLAVTVERQSDYYGSQAQAVSLSIRIIAGIVGLLLGLCATFGALNTMMTAVAQRRREIATLEALGFGALPVIVSVLAEALSLGLLGGSLGGLLAYLLFNGRDAATMNWQTYTQVAFSFEVTPTLLAGGLLYALGVGLVGGLLPAVRAVRLPLAAALRRD